MSQYRNFEIETTIVPDAAGQYEAAFVLRRKQGNPEQQGGESGQQAGQETRYEFPPVGSYMTPDDAREQTEAWAHKWIDANFSE
ncbi:hypothetical protein [Bordetella genomosp. 9]|uniref:Uncharacterized protein n=1 Tax=Bordetella genomosp. 9 TaxID=1416803 RepID=A0A1W6Z299_9BORD|nr:hypothetical protein [Bordetella genomosp. 9]ARP87495.1 hypothetical protein CAL13_15740 [Bordetella genomosp. 9]